MNRNHPTLLVLFGSTGDLTRLKILPALRDLWQEQILPNAFRLILVGRRDYDTEEYFDFLKQVPSHPFTDNVSYLNPEYVSVDFDKPGGFDPLWNKLNEHQNYQIAYYMAVGPKVLNLCVDRFEDQSSIKQMGGRQAVILAEKPFGEDLEDAKQLNQRLAQLFQHNYVLRNDHYLKKDTVQALANLRKNNLYLAEVLSGARTREIKLIVSEQVDLGTRAGYFDSRGMVVDWFQSHMLQILATFCAELNTEKFGMAKAEFIDSLEVVPGTVIRGQYFGYTDTENVSDDSDTETFLALQLKSTLPKWESVVFKLLCGKALDRKEVSVQVKLDETHIKFGDSIHVNIEPPGGNPLLDPPVHDEFSEIIMDCIASEHEEFVSLQEVEAQWKITEQVIEALKDTTLIKYLKGSEYESICLAHGLWC